MQLAGFHHLRQLPAQAHKLFVDGTAVGLDLGFAGTADKAKPAPLPFQVGPGAHQSRALIGQCGHLDLQNAFTGAGAVGKNLKDQPGPVEQLHFPGLFQVALLDRRYRPVDQHKLDLIGLEQLFQLFDLA